MDEKRKLKETMKLTGKTRTHIADINFPKMRGSAEMEGELFGGHTSPRAGANKARAWLSSQKPSGTWCVDKRRGGRGTGGKGRREGGGGKRRRERRKEKEGEG